MLRTRLVKDLDELRGLPFPPPYALTDLVETAVGRSEAWGVVVAYEQHGSQARWVALFPEAGEAWFFSDGDRFRGRWDPEREVFIPEEGSPLDLRGNPVSLAALEEADEDEDAEVEERRRR